MYGISQKRSDVAVQELRREAGRYLRTMRERKGLSQKQLSDQVGTEYYTFISQLETGRGRIPPERYEAWAAALGVEAREFVYNLMRYYDPITFGILFPADATLSPIMDESSSVAYETSDNIVRLK